MSHTVDEDEIVERDTDELGDCLTGWRIRFVSVDATDTVTLSEAVTLARLHVPEPHMPGPRRCWLDALLVGRLLRAAPFTGDETLHWEPWLFDITASLDHFIQTHLHVDGHTEVGEAVMACVSTVPRLQLRLREYDLDAARPAAQAARKIIFDDYVQYLQLKYPRTSPLQQSTETS